MLPNSIADTTHLLYLGMGDINPTDAEIAAAPILDDWYIGEFGLLSYRVVGTVAGHPVLPDGIIATSTPMFADLDRHWLRTRNTLYRLGRHVEARS